MSFLDKYENKQPTIDDVKSLDSQVVIAANSGALGRIIEKNPDILKDYIESAKEILEEQYIQLYIGNIENVINSIKEKVDINRDSSVEKVA